MTNRISIILGIFVLALIALDYLQNDSAALVFLLQKLSALIEYIAFWR